MVTRVKYLNENNKLIVLEEPTNIYHILNDDESPYVEIVELKETLGNGIEPGIVNVNIFLNKRPKILSATSRQARLLQDSIIDNR